MVDQSQGEQLAVPSEKLQTLTDAYRVTASMSSPERFVEGQAQSCTERWRGTGRTPANGGILKDPVFMGR